MSEARETVRCRCCELAQFRTKTNLCRRCKRQLPALFVKIVVKERVTEVPVRVEVPGTLPFGTVLPTMAEHKKALLEEALLRSGGVASKAAELIGLGKTTVHRMRDGLKT